MRSVIAFIIIACFFYWLFGNGIVAFDGLKAKYHMNNAIEKINDFDPEKVGKSGAKSGMENVDRDVNELCGELRDLSQRALMLRKKLLANVIDSTERIDHRSRRR